ncbi:MAG: septum formation family protein [Acidimicrobiales bacterium]
MQRIESTDITVSDLATEFGLSVDEMLGLCEMFEVEADDETSVLTPVGVTVLRGVASGEIDPASTIGHGTELALEAETDRAERWVRPVSPTPRTSESTDRPSRREAGENLPDVPTTSWWARRFPRGYQFDRYVPRWLRFVYLVSVVAVVGVLWLIFGVSGSDDPAKSALFASAPDLTIGSCFDADAGLWLDTATVVPCAGAHDAQAVAIIELEPAGRPYPDLSDLRSESVVLCADHLRTQLTLTEEQSVAVSVPSTRIWEGGDQRVLCSVVHHLGEQLVGSAI